MPTAIEQLCGLGGFDPKVVAVMDEVERRRYDVNGRPAVYAIVLTTVTSSVLAGVATATAAWLAFASNVGATLSGVGAGLALWNLLRLTNAGSALADDRHWRPHRVPLAILATLGVVLAQPMLVLAEARHDGGASVRYARHAFVELRREVVEDTHDKNLEVAKAELRRATADLRRIEAERERGPTLGAEAYSAAALELVRRDREAQDRVAALRDRVDTMSVVGPAYVTDLVPYAYHVGRSPLFTYRLGHVWERPVLAALATAAFAIVVCAPLLLRFVFPRLVYAYLETRWIIDHRGVAPLTAEAILAKLPRG